VIKECSADPCYWTVLPIAVGGAGAEAAALVDLFLSFAMNRLGVRAGS
jgi:hypothetical protein